MFLEWIRADLHHHTKRDKARTESDFDTAKIIDKYIEEKCKLTVISNHGEINVEDIIEYEAAAEEKKYELTVLPGVELRFLMDSEKDNISSNTGHVVLIFDKISPEKIIKINKILKNDEYYSEKDGAAYVFDKYFVTLMNKISDITKKFLIMPHSSKTNQIDFKTLGSDQDKTTRLLYYFDLFEGKSGNNKSIESIKDMIKKGAPEREAPVAFGTDARNMQEFVKRLSELKFLLIKPNFDGLFEMSNFPEGRVSNSHKDVPMNIIKEFKIDDKPFKFDIGLNVIIGRRGSGKSVLLRNIYRELSNKDENFPKMNIDIPNAKNILSDDILLLGQNELSKSIDDFILKQNTFDNQDYEIIPKYFIGKNRKNFMDKIEEYKNALKSYKETSKELINCLLSLRENDAKETFRNKLFHLLNALKDKINEYSNKVAIKTLKSDLILLKNLDISNGSEWLSSKINHIKLEIENLLKSDKYTTSDFINFMDKKLENEIGIISREDNSVSLDKNKKKLVKIISDILKKDNIKPINDLANIFKHIWKDVEDKRLFITKDQIINGKDFLTSDTIISKFYDVENVSQLFKKFKSIGYSAKGQIKSTNTAAAAIKSFYDTETIIKIDGESIKNDSMGTKHQKFIDQILNITEKTIILLDQPDDDLDSITIEENIIKRIRESGASKQWIIVTHDPKIAINSDARNTILANYKKASIEKVDENYKGMEHKDIVDYGYKILDSKKIYPSIRSKIYSKGGIDE